MPGAIGATQGLPVLGVLWLGVESRRRCRKPPDRGGHRVFDRLALRPPPETAKASPIRASSEPDASWACTVDSDRAKASPIRASSEPPGQALSHLKTPGKNAKNAAPPPRFAGPAPTAATMDPDAFGQYPAGSRSEDDPCLGLRARRTGGALASSLSGIGAT